jgi:peptide/nickel transport system substrate-binding protein
MAWHLSTAVAADNPTDPLKSIRIAINTDIRGTNPGVNRDSNTDAVMHHIVEALVGYGEDLTVKPIVAESFEVDDEGHFYTFRLRDGLRFHNGQPVTSAEVKWSWERYLDPATGWQCRRWFTASDDDSDQPGSVIESIVAPDSLTVIFELAEPNALFLDQMSNVQCVSAVLHPESVSADGEWVSPVGTGPYKLAEWRHGDYVELERFDGYLPRSGEIDGLSGRKQAIADRVRFLVSPDAASTKAALLAGQIDIFHNTPMNSISELEKSEKTSTLRSPTLSWTALLVQTRDPLLSDIRIRRAIAHAIDRQMIANFNTYGYASVNSSGVPVAAASHTPVHDEWYSADVEKARQLLKEAGYRGQPVRIQANRKYANMYANAVVIQAMLHAAGMNAHIDVMDWASQLANYYAGDYQLSAFSFSAQATPVLRYFKMIGDKDKRPVYMWENPKALALRDELLATADETERRRLYERLHKLSIEDIPIIGLYNSQYAAATVSKINGFQPWPLVIPRLWGVSKDEWNAQ